MVCRLKISFTQRDTLDEDWPTQEPTNDVFLNPPYWCSHGTILSLSLRLVFMDETRMVMNVLTTILSSEGTIWETRYLSLRLILPSILKRTAIVDLSHIT